MIGHRFLRRVPSGILINAYLVPLDDAQRVLGDSALDTDGPAWLTGRREQLHDRLREVRAKLVAGRLDGVRLEKSRLKITPYDPLTPPAGERLDRTIDALMPRIRITDLLWDVHAFTGFLDAFTDLRSGRVHANPAALLASILAGATNLGLERMARASSGVSHAQLSWASAWCLRSETYANALGGSSTPTTPCRSPAYRAAPAGPRRTGSSLCRVVATPGRSTRNTGRIRASKSTPSCQGVTDRSIPT